MRMLRSLVGALVLVAAPPTGPELNERTYTRYRDHIRPRPAELSWQEIPWRSTFWDAVVEAQRKDQPILVWAMNGHPLACT
jgi:hypothetical protein